MPSTTMKQDNADIDVAIAGGFASPSSSAGAATA
jgi:hypothetical protein